MKLSTIIVVGLLCVALIAVSILIYASIIITIKSVSISDKHVQINDAANEVFSIMGPGHKEAAYRDALSIELNSRGVTANTEVPQISKYKGIEVGGIGKADIVADNYIIELKSTKTKLDTSNRLQLKRYLSIDKINGGNKKGVLINFPYRETHEIEIEYINI